MVLYKCIIKKEENNIKILHYEDHMYPEKLREIEKPPKILYALGNVELLKERNIAIVGSRCATEYGILQAEKFAKELCLNGLNIVSGLAKGIDTIAHQCTIQQNKKTIAVLGSGFYNIYPKENEKLFCEILEKNGLIISEYEPNEGVKSSNFPERNRIISGISMGVLVVEAAYRSGTSITANYAKKQGKKLYAIPSNIGNNKGVGTARLISKGAKIVINPKQILEDLKIEYKEFKKEKTKNRTVKIPEKFKKIYTSLENKEMTSDEISIKLNIPIYEINVQLILMELEGYIIKKENGEYKVNNV